MTGQTIALALLAALSTVGLTCRLIVGYFVERNRWRTVERIADRHGSEVFTELPNLAREICAQPWRYQLRRRRTDDVDDPDHEIEAPSSGRRNRRRR
jgi:hypothetical protein